MRKKTIILLVLIPVFLSSCWDQRIFEQIGFILNLGIESSKNDELLITYTAPAIGAAQKGAVELISTTGHILREGRVNARRRASRFFEAGKIQQVLISSELAQSQGAHKFLEVLERDPIDPIQAWVVIVDGSPNELLKKAAEFKNKPRPSIYINQLLIGTMKSCNIPDTKIYDFDINYFAPGIDPITPIIKLGTNDIIVTGSALFSGEKMAGKIDPQETSLLLSLMDRIGRSEFSFICPTFGSESESGKEKMSATIKDAKRKIAVKIENNRPVINITLNVDSVISEYKWDELSKEEEQNKVERYLEKNIKDECMKVIYYMQKTGSDPIGVGEMVRARYNSFWKSIDWQDTYKDAVFNISINLDIKEYGAID